MSQKMGNENKKDNKFKVNSLQDCSQGGAVDRGRAVAPLLSLLDATQDKNKTEGEDED